VLITALAAGPLVHVAALALDVRFLNFGSGSLWNHFIYLVVSPSVAWFLATRHARARFSLYVFLTFEAYRGLKVASPTLIALAGLGLLYFQLPAVRGVYPRVDPRDVLARIRRLGAPWPRA